MKTGLMPRVRSRSLFTVVRTDSSHQCALSHMFQEISMINVQASLKNI